jgi:hypothetical protein
VQALYPEASPFASKPQSSQHPNHLSQAKQFAKRMDPLSGGAIMLAFVGLASQLAISIKKLYDF